MSHIFHRFMNSNAVFYRNHFQIRNGLLIWNNNSPFGIDLSFAIRGNVLAPYGIGWRGFEERLVTMTNISMGSNLKNCFRSVDQCQGTLAVQPLQRTIPLIYLTFRIRYAYVWSDQAYPTFFVPITHHIDPIHKKD